MRRPVGREAPAGRGLRTESRERGACRVVERPGESNGGLDDPREGRRGSAGSATPSGNQGDSRPRGIKASRITSAVLPAISIPSIRGSSRLRCRAARARSGALPDAFVVATIRKRARTEPPPAAFSSLREGSLRAAPWRRTVNSSPRGAAGRHGPADPERELADDREPSRPSRPRWGGASLAEILEIDSARIRSDPGIREPERQFSASRGQRRRRSPALVNVRALPIRFVRIGVSFAGSVGTLSSGRDLGRKGSPCAAARRSPLRLWGKGGAKRSRLSSTLHDSIADVEDVVDQREQRFALREPDRDSPLRRFNSPDSPEERRREAGSRYGGPQPCETKREAVLRRTPLSFFFRAPSPSLRHAELGSRWVGQPADCSETRAWRPRCEATARLERIAATRSAPA